MNFGTLDTEIDGKTVAKRFCNQFVPEHKVIMVQWKRPGKEAEVYYNTKSYKSGIPEGFRTANIDLSEVKCIVGQHIKFDLLWMWKELEEFFKSGGQVWDIMTVEHLLNGQMWTKEGNGLDALSVRYGFPTKDNRVEEYFNEGLQFSDIPKDIAIDYGKHDVNVEEGIFLKQYKRAKAMGMLPLIKSHMQHYLAVCEIEYNGIWVDRDILEKKRENLEETKEDLENQLKRIASMTNWEVPVDFMPSSTKHVSAYLFGGIIPYDAPMPILDEEGNFTYYKSGKKAGQKKTRKERIERPIKGLLNPAKYSKINKTAKGEYQVGDEQLDFLQEDLPEFINLLKEYRKVSKELGTYIKGYESAISPDGYIHPSFSTAGTVTGRLSCSEPNMQNVYPKVKDMFTSRWGEDGLIINLDYSQLEVLIQAWLTQDKQFLDDILSGRDFHCQRLSYIENIPYSKVVQLCGESAEWELKRKETKKVSFAKAFGAGVNLIAKNAGLPVETIEEIFNKEDERYPDIKNFNDLVLDEVSSSAIPTKNRMRIRDKTKGISYDSPDRREIVGTYISILGKRYKFKQRAVKTARGSIFEYWHTPEIANYPVQGTALDIVAEMVGRVWREYAIHNRDKFVMFCETHDSLTLDCKKEYAEEVAEKVKFMMEDVKKALKESYGVDFNVPLSVDYNIGKNWKEAK